jgi:hypothetical protein
LRAPSANRVPSQAGVASSVLLARIVWLAAVNIAAIVGRVAVALLAGHGGEIATPVAVASNRFAYLLACRARCSRWYRYARLECLIADVYFSCRRYAVLLALLQGAGPGSASWNLDASGRTRLAAVDLRCWAARACRLAHGFVHTLTGKCEVAGTGGLIARVTLEALVGGIDAGARERTAGLGTSALRTKGTVGVCHGTRAPATAVDARAVLTRRKLGARVSESAVNEQH